MPAQVHNTRARGTKVDVLKDMFDSTPELMFPYVRLSMACSTPSGRRGPISRGEGVPSARRTVHGDGSRSLSCAVGGIELRACGDGDATLDAGPTDPEQIVFAAYELLANGVSPARADRLR